MRGVAVVALAMLLAVPRLASAQDWVPGTAIDLVRRAADHRSRRDADSAVASWHARAHGVVRFTSLTGYPPDQLERVLRADELRVEVYGAGPGRNKQVIVAWRDTSFLPNTMRYHRDHLGIVANDFGGTIRIGEGDEVSDLIHPLSPLGLEHYRFALGDTTVIASATDRVRVVAVKVRPTDPRAPGVVGTLYLDADRAALVRFVFTFTPASYRDPTVADITVTLDNALQQEARWLPWRQSIAIRRGSPLLDLPWQTIIRGDWQIDDYELGVVQPANRFAGMAIDGLQRPAPGATWHGAITDLLTTLPASDADIARAQREASRALQGRSLDGLPGVRFFAHGVGDFLHVNRVQGVTPGFGLRVGLGAALTARGQVGIGLSDHRLVGEADLSRSVGVARLSLVAGRVMQDVGDVPVISSVLNSFQTAVAGRDLGDYALVERFGLRLTTALAKSSLAIEAGREHARSVAAAFTAIDGTRHSNPALGAAAATVARVALARRDANGNGWSVAVEGGQADSSWGRAVFGLQATVPVGRDALILQADAGAGTVSLPGYRAFVLGGRGSLVGIRDRELGGRRSARVELAWAMPAVIPMPALTSRVHVRLPSTVSVLAAAGFAGGAMTGVPWRASGVIEPVAGVRLDLWGPLLRLEGGVALRTGHTGITFDIHPDWWRFF